MIGIGQLFAQRNAPLFNMNYELTISRIGALAGTTRAPFRTDDVHAVLAAFDVQLKTMMEDTRAFAQGHAAIVAAAPGARCVKAPGDNTEEKISTYRVLSDQSVKGSDGWTWVGILPPTKLKMTVPTPDGKSHMDWILRARCSVTACALHESSRQSKIWLTFEGVPANSDPLNRPTAQNVADFVALTDRMESQSMELFHNAYGQALKRTVPGISLRNFRLSKPRIRVRMADTNDPRASALLDAMYFGARTVAEIREGGTPSLMRAQKGLVEFEKLLDGVEHRKVINRILHKSEGSVGPMGAFYRTVDRKTKDTIVVGVGYQLGTVSGQEDVAPEKRISDTKEGYLRAVSAVRPISANVAQVEAIRLERRLAHH